jgi:inosine/xanthosine triphosphatase
MAKVVIASQNPVKAEAVRGGFQRLFPRLTIEILSVDSDSQVSVQPRSDEETIRGASNRAEDAARQVPEADYWVGIEGGIQDDGHGMSAFAWVVVKSATMTGKARSGTFYLPTRIADLIRQGRELGEADDIVFEQDNSKQKDGAIGLLTGNVINRTALYEHGVILALLPFKNKALYE